MPRPTPRTDLPRFGTAVTAAAVLGMLDRERLSGVLAALHRAGFGPHTRVLDGARGDLAGQVRRASLERALDPASLPADAVIVVVSAAGRTAAVGSLLRAHGATMVGALTKLAAAPSDAARAALPDISPEVGERPGVGG